MDQDQDKDLLVIWGRNPIMEAITAGRTIEKVLIAHDSHPPARLLRLTHENGIKLQKVPRRKVEAVAKTKKTQGVVALMSPVEFANADDLIKKTIEEKGVLLILDHLTDPQNVGGLIRTAEVLGVIGVLMPKERSCPLNETVVKASAGAIFHLPIAKVTNLRQVTSRFQKAGGWVVALEKGGTKLSEIDFPFPIALIAGAEGRGVAQKLLENADIRASITMRGQVTSLNVASATAIALHQILSQFKG